MSDRSSNEEIFLNIQSEPPLLQLEAAASCTVSCGEVGKRKWRQGLAANERDRQAAGMGVEARCQNQASIER